MTSPPGPAHAAAGIPQAAIDAAVKASVGNWPPETIRAFVTTALAAAAPHLQAAGRWHPIAMSLHFDDADPVATCQTGDCRWHAHGDSVNGAALAWTKHVAQMHRQDWDDDGSNRAAPGRYPGGATRDEAYRDEKWEDATL